MYVIRLQVTEGTNEGDQIGRPYITMTSTRLWHPAVLVKTRVWLGCSVLQAHKTLVEVQTNAGYISAKHT